MPQKMYLINSPEFSEYVFFAMSTAPQEAKLKLTSKELEYFKDLKTMRRFADNETMEKRLLLLAKLEIPFCLVMGERTNVEHALDEIYTQYKYVEKRKALTDAMARKKIFVLASNNVLLGLHMAAQNSHSRVYILNYDYVKLNQRLLETGSNTVNQDVKDARSGFEILSRATLLTSLRFKDSQQMFGVGPFELQVLLALYPYMTTFVSANKVYEIMNEDVRSRGIIKACTEMEKNGYLRGLPGFNDQRNKVRSYTLAEKGVNTVMEFLKYIANNSLYGFKI